MKGHSSWAPACLRRLYAEAGEDDGVSAAGDFCGFPISCSTAGAAALFSQRCLSPRSVAGCDSANLKLVFPLLSRDALFTEPGIVPLSFSRC